MGAVSGFQLHTLRLLAIALTACLFALTSGLLGVGAQERDASLPPLQVHPLPPALAQWQVSPQMGDYFAEVKPSPLGYLIWWEFPVKIYLDKPAGTVAGTASSLRFQQWVGTVRQAVGEWSAYLPLTEVEQPEQADITIKRVPPPLGSKFNPETGKLEIPRARSAQTRYEFYIREGNPPVLCHRMSITLSPGLSEQSLLSAARHELGHALGIWGHSPVETDALYFSGVRQPPPISERDVNTLKQIYQQPTRLGWSFPS